MYFTERVERKRFGPCLFDLRSVDLRRVDLRTASVSVAAVLLAACTSSPMPPLAPAPATPVAVAAPARAVNALPAPKAARNWDEFKHQAATRMVAASPHLTYGGPVPDPLYAIPVLEIELEADGSIRKIIVVRVPSQNADTTEIAIEAARRAAPYGDMRHLSKPWKYTEVFLFNDDRRFKPRTLDE